MGIKKAETMAEAVRNLRALVKLDVQLLSKRQLEAKADREWNRFRMVNRRRHGAQL